MSRSDLNNTYPHPIIAREGWPCLGGIFIATLIVQAITGFGWAWPFWVLALFVLQSFRGPTCAVPTQTNAILSPADGRIVAIEQVHNPYADHDALKIGMFMDAFSMHLNHVPIGGMVQQVQYFPGKFINADLDRVSFENKRNAIVLRRADGQPITSVQVARLITRRILCYAKTGGALIRGQRYSFIRFGSRINVYLPLVARPYVTIGEKVFATLTMFAELD